MRYSLLVDVAIQCDLAAVERRTLLLGHCDATMIASMPVLNRPRDQIVSDLYYLSRSPSLLRSWIRAAIVLSRDQWPESARLFERELHYWSTEGAHASANYC